MNKVVKNIGDRDYRQQLSSKLKEDSQWDIIVIGGGIVGAAVLREAARLNLKALLLEQQDFAWGTSSRSSKMVHGGLRYIATGDFKITRESVEEREHLLQEAPGLINPMQYLFADRKGKYPGRWMFTALLWIYDLFARRADHRFLRSNELYLQAPHLNDKGLTGACQYMDASTDDARLVLRVLQEAMAEGVDALNYVKVIDLLKDNDKIIGVKALNQCNNETLTIKAKTVINATGAWADKLRECAGGKKTVRPLRGSHIIFPYWRLPVSQSITFMHPRDHRPIFIFPWEGASVVGTTDLDHPDSLDNEAHITREEVDYLFAAVDSQFPSAQLSEQDVISTYAGIRPVIGTGMLNPSAEKRDHCVWDDNALITVTGGKLTTFRIIARDVLKAASAHLPITVVADHEQQIFSRAEEPEHLRLLLTADQSTRMLGRYGKRIIAWIEQEAAENLQLIPGTPTLWTELKWAAANESVCHLDDLLLRRTRIGLLIANGAQAHLEQIKTLCQPLLGWDDQRWQQEVERYQQIWKNFYSLPA
jgi:glycerol-3-phosphate dehydrogenase